MRVSGITINYNINFNGKKKVSEETIAKRVDYLKTKDITEIDARELAELNNKLYRKAMPLVLNQISPLRAKSIAKLQKREYRQARKLCDNGIFDDSIIPIAKLHKKEYNTAIDLWNKGIDSDVLFYLAKLPPANFKMAEFFLQQGYTPKEAAFLAIQSKEQRKLSDDFKDFNIEPETLNLIVKSDSKKREECKKNINSGINPDMAFDLTFLNLKEKQRIEQLKKLKIDDENLLDFASLDAISYKKALKLLNSGVISHYIPDIIDIEFNGIQNEEYKKYRKQGLSMTSSFILSIFDEKEHKDFKEIIDYNPEIIKLLKEEYEIIIINNQLTQKAEALLINEKVNKEGIKTTTIHLFSETEEHQTSILKEYPDKSTVSILNSCKSLFRTKYDRNGEIDETIHFFSNEETGKINGAVLSKASKVLNGSFDSTYFKIYPEITLKQAAEEDISCNIVEKEIISKSTQHPDGIKTYEEDFNINDYNVKRYYAEKKDNNDKIIYSSYSYKITKYTGEELLDIENSTEYNKDGSKTNIINGIRYRITYDNENKCILITDGKRTKTIDMKDKLPFYSEEVIWDSIKKLDVSSLLTIEKADMWKYCLDEDACADENNNCISTGKNQNIISHELGHLKDYQVKYLSDNEELVNIYGNEMYRFINSFPYNEQRFISYFSPHADLSDVDGLNEFIAETNILLNSYGTNHYELKTRPQFLARYFPESIAKVAELTGKNSKKSLLEL